MKLLLLIPFLFCGCQVGYTFKSGNRVDASFNPTPKDVVALEGLAR